MEFIGEVKNIRLKSSGLDKLTKYLSKPENRGAVISDCRLYQWGNDVYFSIDLNIHPFVYNESKGRDYGGDSNRIVDFVNSLEQLKDDGFLTNFERQIEELGLSTRSYNLLKAGKIKTVGELVRFREGDLLKIYNMGRKSLREIKDKLYELNLSLGMGRNF